MSEFEDRELAERLGRASGAFPDENAAYATVLRGARRAKRRRALAACTTAVAVIVALALYPQFVLKRTEPSATVSVAPAARAADNDLRAEQQPLEARR